MCNYKCYSWLILFQYSYKWSRSRSRSCSQRRSRNCNLSCSQLHLFRAAPAPAAPVSFGSALINPSFLPWKIVGYRQKSTYKNCNVKHWLGHWCMHILKPPMDQRQPWGWKNSPSNNSSPAHVKNIFEGLSDCTLYSTHYTVWVDRFSVCQCVLSFMWGIWLMAYKFLIILIMTVQLSTCPDKSMII